MSAGQDRRAATATGGGAPPTVGLVGCGLWGRLILRDLVALRCAVTVVDPSAEARGRALAGGAVAAVPSLDGAPDPDGWIVSTPAVTHAAVVDALLQRSAPVFCEKPFTVDRASAAALAARGQGRLFVMHVWRYHPGIEALAALARSGELGPVEWLRTTRTNGPSPRRDIDPVWTLAPHDLSIALAILGRIPEPRCAVAEMHDGRPAGMVAVLGDGPLVVLEVSTRHRGKRREVRLHCRDGVAVLAGGEATHVEIHRGGTDPAGEPAPPERRAVATEPPLLRELRAFVVHLGGGPPPPTDAAEGLAVVEAMVALRALAGIP